jgi:hypothetical protein
MVKLDLDTVPTVPEAPPAAGPDRAFDPPPAGPGAPAGRLPDTGGAADAEGDVARPTESPMTGDITAVANSKRRTFRRRGLLAMVTEAGSSGPMVALVSERVEESTSRPVGLYSFVMVPFFLIEASHRLLAVHVSSLQGTCVLDRSCSKRGLHGHVQRHPLIGEVAFSAHNPTARIRLPGAVAGRAVHAAPSLELRRLSARLNSRAPCWYALARLEGDPRSRSETV